MKPFVHLWALSLIITIGLSGAVTGADPAATNIPDAGGDVDPQVKEPGYDIKSVTIEKKGSDRISLIYDCAGDIPQSVESYTMFCAKLDLDRNANTGQAGKFGMGSEINVRIFRQPAMREWTGAVDNVSPVTAPIAFAIKELEVKKNRATIVIQSKFFRDLTAFDFGLFCEAKARPADTVPETGFITVQLKE